MALRRDRVSRAALAALRVDLDHQAPEQVRLIPAGHFRARDGRPQGLPQGWHLDAAGAERLMATARGRRDASVIDYEHQTLHTEANGQPAPAAGWFDPAKLQWRPDGLYATDVRWTAAATAAIEAGEYRYLSPVLLYDPRTGQVQDVTMAALTNYAAIDGLDGLSARAAARFNNPPTLPEDSIVDRDELIKLLGLDAQADEAAVLTALTALKETADQTAAARDEVAALKAQVAQATAAAADPAKFVPLEQLEALKGELAALRSESNEQQVAALVTAGLDDGKLLPAQAEWARDLGRRDLAALKAYLEKTPAIAALKGSQSGGTAPAGADDEALTESQLAICKATGVDPEAYRKQLAGAAA